MILCVNANAAVDKTVVVDSFAPGRIHRPERVLALPGGKGANVARALRRLGAQPVVTGWVGGDAGRFIEGGLQAEGIATDFVQVPHESRTCLSILDAGSRVLTEIYERGEPIDPEAIEALVARVGRVAGRAAAVALSGSLPPGVPADFYARLIEVARAAGVPAFLDSSGEPLKLGAAARPFLIKPNASEVGILIGEAPETPAALAAAAAAIAARHHTTVVLSLGPDGAIAARERELVWVQPPPVTAQSAVGSGDALLAGLIDGFTRGGSLVEAVERGVAAGTANALTVGAGQFERADFERILAGVRAGPPPGSPASESHLP